MPLEAIFTREKVHVFSYSTDGPTLLKVHPGHPQITLVHSRIEAINTVPRKEKDEPHRGLGWMMKVD
jgi:hypothetical protein